MEDYALICDVQVVETTPSRITLRVTAKDGVPVDGRDLAAEFLNYVLDMAATKLRTKKSFLNGFTKLHMFVLTLRCEHSCLYCQVSRQTEDRVRYDMSRETADKALDVMFSSPSPFLTLEFQGGEPFLAFSLM